MKTTKQPAPKKVVTTDYENNHGAKPRGRGNWFFAFSNEGRWWDFNNEHLYSCAGLYSDCARRVLALAKERGYNGVKVMP